MTDKMLNTDLAGNPQMMARSCRSRAMTMREIAAAMHDPHTREALLRQAVAWDEMAASAELRAGRITAHEAEGH
jgi:hypothetical protein